MPKDSLKNLMKMFPFFFDKSENSNFYKSQKVTNNQFKELYQSLYDVANSFRLNKRGFIWKEQNAPYDYTIHFAANYPNLKSVELYQNDEVLYSTSFSDEDHVDTFSYDYNPREERIFEYNYEDGWVTDPLSTSGVTTSTEGRGLKIMAIGSGLMKYQVGGDILQAPYYIGFRCYHVGNHISFGYMGSTHGSYGVNIDFKDYVEDGDYVLLKNTGENVELYVNDKHTATFNIVTGDALHKFYFGLIGVGNYFILNDFTITSLKDYYGPLSSNTFKMIAETYDEYVIKKGFPENDEIQGDEFDHDSSLDKIGVLNGIPRKTYKVTDDYANTEPPYNDRLSEDDYHYMKRILEYNLRLHNTPLPVLEIWKNYGIFSDMVNREQYLLKMFDENKHLDENGVYDPDWIPQPWEHKDKLCTLQPDLGKFFFVSANTLLPVKNQSVKFTLEYLNSLAEKLTGNYDTTITLKGDEEDTVLVEHFTGGQYTVTSDVIVDDEPNVFLFEAFENGMLFASEELTVNVRGCSTADWYVSPNGDDTNTGKSSSSPFATIDKAISMVDGEQNLIVLTSGTHTVNHTINVPFTCTILGCGGATISNTTNLRFFKVYQNQSLNLQDVTLSFGDISVEVEDANFVNNNKTNNPLYVILQEPQGGMLLTASAGYVASGDEITITVTLTDENGDPVEGAEVELYKVTT